MDEHPQAKDNRALGPAGPRPETAELAESRPRRSAYLALHQLSCDFRAGVLTLRGRLPSYYLKQVALAVVTTVEGVQCLDDQVEVAAHADASASRGFRPARR
jgi:hypothetical protein